MRRSTVSTLEEKRGTDDVWFWSRLLRIGRVAVRRDLLAANLILLTAANTAVVVSGQAREGQAAADLQKPIEQLMEQNRKLEQQNRQLMEQNRELMQQINSLRPSLAKQD